MSTAEAAEVLARTLPVMAFLVAITVVAEIADLAGVFDVAGHATARLAGHRTVVLWLLLAALAVLVTAFLGLDTTAVLLTPVALTVARQVGVGAAPFALTTLFLANTASLFLPVSNLTNLLAVQHLATLGAGHGDFVRLTLLPGLAAVAGTLLVIGLVHRRALTGCYAVEPPHSWRPLTRQFDGVALTWSPGQGQPRATNDARWRQRRRPQHLAHLADARSTCSAVVSRCARCERRPRRRARPSMPWAWVSPDRARAAGRPRGPRRPRDPPRSAGWRR